MPLSTITVLFILLLASPAKAQDAQLDVVPLFISGNTLLAEVANTRSSRMQGLMNRKTLDENRGMLFVFPSVGRYSMWMQNTYIPLSVAFINEQGVILNIKRMEPLTKTVHSSLGDAKFALEMNAGWFARREIKAGDQVKGLIQASVAY